ncbi:homeobox protein Nkx-2.6 isoform X2 [Ornithorhynchus anatinus]|uniref:homeobox protein Nkx-2.6 isoform X2 n=1 Tax=Ornithorhynchus anatinus TaxID=9258 RepID=UPI0010A7CB40|nr:homeobox protein Nkx-2.6 isoform X2 [Ornithorhynchus anatinus]
MLPSPVTSTPFSVKDILRLEQQQGCQAAMVPGYLAPELPGGPAPLLPSCALGAERSPGGGAYLRGDPGSQGEDGPGGSCRRIGDEFEALGSPCHTALDVEVEMEPAGDTTDGEKEPRNRAWKRSHVGGDPDTKWIWKMDTLLEEPWNWLERKVPASGEGRGQFGQGRRWITEKGGCKRRTGPKAFPRSRENPNIAVFQARARRGNWRSFARDGAGKTGGVLQATEPGFGAFPRQEAGCSALCSEKSQGWCLLERFCASRPRATDPSLLLA